MSRFKCVRGIVSYKGKKYKQGEFLPESFTMKDRMHNTWPHRIVEVPDDQIPEELKVKAAPLTGVPNIPLEVAAKATIKTGEPSKGTAGARVNPASPVKNPGTSPVKAK